MKQRAIFALHPRRQKLVYPVRHFGRASLGKGDAQ
jgi:hypothetical protein